MGAKVKVREGETVEQVMRRLRKQIEMFYRYPIYRPKPTKRSLRYFQKPAEVRHQRRSLAKTRQRQNRNAALREFGLR